MSFRLSCCIRRYGMVIAAGLWALPARGAEVEPPSGPAAEPVAAKRLVETAILVPAETAQGLRPEHAPQGPTTIDSATDSAAGAREGGETCADALVINALPFDDTGDTRNNTNDYESPNCNDDVNQSNDVVYKYSPPANQVVRISCCNTDTTQAGGHQDTRLWVYESDVLNDPGDCVPGNEIACNDDDANQCLPQVTAPRTSEIEAVEMLAGRTYYIIMDGWNGENGIYAINVREVDPGTCCTNAGGPNSCEENVSPLECTCLTAKFTEGAQVCLEADCYSDPVPAAGTCPPTHIFGPGFNTGAVSFFVIASDDTFGSSHSEAYWDTNEPLKFYTWSGVYALLPGLGGACDKPDAFTVAFYADDCGMPGEVIAGPFDVTPSRDGTGFAFAGTSQIFNFTAALPVSVSFATAWIAVAAKADPNNPDCVFRTLAYGDEGTATGQTGDLKSVILGPGAPFPFTVGGDMAMCVSAPDQPGACCNDQTGGCADNVMPEDCPPPSRFAEDTACAELDPPCGMGACCTVDGECNLTNQAGCTGTWKPGVACAFANCPPSNDNCALVSPATGGLPYAFTNRTNGATDDDCPGLGVASGWEAFTLTECSDLVLDYCGTAPAFSGNAADFLLESCCDLPANLSAVSTTRTARTGTCCRDEPPGYDPNLAITFHGVPPGTWYYPVFSGGGSLGDYSITVTGGPTSPDNHGDANGNFRVDLEDAAILMGCLSGPGGAFSDSACACLIDHDADGDVDLRDYARFQQQRTACSSCSGTPEGEAGCSGANDTCATADPLACNTTVCGTSATHDVDHYVVTVGSGSTLTWSVSAEFPVTISIRDVSLGCEGAEIVAASGETCETVTASACVVAGTYLVTVAPQAGHVVACGSSYRGTVTCGGSCTPAARGACCRAGGTCTANALQAACEAAEGKYQGDGSTCPCPTPVAGDECLTAVTLTGASGTRTFNRSQITSNSSDPLNNCEINQGGPFAKDGSIWFRWNSPSIGVPRLNLDLCCQGGAAGSADTLITLFADRPLNDPPGTACPAITAANGAELACDDDSCVIGTGGAFLCVEGGATGNPGMLLNRTYWILVEIFDSGGADEQESFTLNYSTSSCTARTCPSCATPVPCPGGASAENEQTQSNYCGLDYVDNYNSGCNPLSRVPPAPEAFAVEIECGDTVCGSAGYYNTTGGSPTDRRRDTDWYLLYLTEETTVNWSVQSQTEGAQALLINVDDCANVLILESAADLDSGNEPAPGCGPVTVSGTVPAGRYAVFASFLHPEEANDPGETINCPAAYVGSLSCQRGDVLATPSDHCAGAPTLTGGGRYTGLFGAPAVQTPDGESSCDGALADPGFCDGAASDDIHWKYTAPCTGQVSFEVRRGPAPMVLSAHSACPANCATELPGGLGVSCSDFGGGTSGVQPKLTLNVEAGITYVIRLAGAMSGPYELTVSDCVVACDGRCGDGELDGGEECDDGNLISGDGCDHLCQSE